MRGRKPQPTALKVIRGNPGRRALNPDEPQPAALDLQPPDWLDDDAKAEWHRLAPMLGALRVLTETDADALAAYCESWATWKSATQQIRKWGMVLKAKDGAVPVVSPYVKIAHNALLHMRALLVEFGMTPSSRARIHAPKPAREEPASKWAGLK